MKSSEKYFINLLHHEVRLIDKNGNQLVLPPNKEGAARVSIRPHLVGEVQGVPIYELIYGEVQGVPSPDEDPNAVYVVSAHVKKVLTDRKDVVAPYKTSRDKSGAVMFSTALRSNH